MTRKSKREIEDDVDRLKSALGSGRVGEPIELTEKDREHIDALFTDPEDLGEERREHYENLKEWVADEDPEEYDRGPHELTPAQMALLDFLIASEGEPIYFPEEYYERFPDAPRPGFGEEYA
jgi:hypothetical protein